MKLLVLIIGSWLLLSCAGPPKQEEVRSAQDGMAAIIAQNDSLGHWRNLACKSISLEATIRQYASDLQRLDYSGYPEAFAQAFQSHSTAWASLLPVVEPYDSLRGEMHDLFDLLAQSPDSSTFNSLVDNVWSTWSEVEAALEENQ